MPDVQPLAAPVSTTQPVLFRPRWDLDVARVGDAHGMSLANLATILGLAILCWVPIAAILLALLA